MKRLWAPWRIKYIVEKKAPGCIFCIHKTKGYVKRHHILAETVHSYALLNRYPYTAGHTMIVPKKHVSWLDGLTQDEIHDFFHLLHTATEKIKDALNPDGFNIGANIGKTAGAGVAEHLHFHIVARWNGDHNFMPVIGDSMIISEELDKTYERLLSCFSD